MEIELKNEEEARTLLQLLDIAVRAQGFQVIDSCNHFRKKIQTQLELNQKELKQPTEDEE